MRNEIEKTLRSERVAFWLTNDLKWRPKDQHLKKKSAELLKS